MYDPEKQYGDFLMRTEPKRPLPGKEGRSNREHMYKSIMSLEPLCPLDKNIVGHTPGNKKTGVAGRHLTLFGCGIFRHL